MGFGFWPAQALTPIHHLWDELEQRLQARKHLVPDFNNALTAQWVQIPAAKI